MKALPVCCARDQRLATFGVVPYRLATDRYPQRPWPDLSRRPVLVPERQPDLCVWVREEDWCSKKSQQLLQAILAAFPQIMQAQVELILRPKDSTETPVLRTASCPLLIFDTDFPDLVLWQQAWVGACATLKCVSLTDLLSDPQLKSDLWVQARRFLMLQL